jgi:hypothetical protein
MAPDEIAKHVCDSCDAWIGQAGMDGRASDWESFRDRMLAWIMTVEPATAFEGLMAVLQAQTNYRYQSLAAVLMEHSDCACPLSLSDFLLQVLPTLNGSVDGVPRYLSKVFGRENVLRALHEMRSQGQDKGLIRHIDTMRYWLGEHRNVQ